MGEVIAESKQPDWTYGHSWLCARRKLICTAILSRILTVVGGLRRMKWTCEPLRRFRTLSLRFLFEKEKRVPRVGVISKIL
jgi:hypothetical protein